MKADKLMRGALAALVALCSASAAFAGGPLEIFDPAKRVPYRWPAGTTPVYLDSDGLGMLDGLVFLDNAAVDERLAFAVQQWNDVPTATFTGAIAGDLASLGLPNIDASNFSEVLGAWNGGGVHVVYDQDGSIHDALFGPYSGVLGFAVIEWVDDKSPAIAEATLVLNGGAIPTWETPADAAAQYTGVVTHELGHAFGLAHSQTNGQLYFFFEAESGPAGCPTPWPWAPYDSIPASTVETMFPFINLSATGSEQATVDRLDDRNAFSDLYPVPGWPESFPSIRGTVSAPGKDAGTPYTGANVIARNIADPFGDAVSALSGDHSQGRKGPDGSYAFSGLLPGASYALYLDGIRAGAFSTPLQTVLPGPEEYWNGALESGDGVKDDRCAFTAIQPVAGKAVKANVTFNRVKGAPTFTPIDLPNSWISSLSGDGSVAVGYWAGGHLRWTPKRGTVDLGGDAGYFGSPQPAVSDDGKTIAGTILQNGNAVAALWKKGTWTPLGGYAGATPCDGLLSSAWGVANDRTVVGLGWHDCVTVSGFSSLAGKPLQSLGSFGDSSMPGSRANAVSADGTLVVGWDRDDFGDWRGARWDEGVQSLFQLATPATCGDPGSPFESWSFVGTAQGLNGPGSAVVGEGYPIERSYFDPDSGTTYRYCDGGAWLWTQANGLQWLGAEPYPDFSGSASDVSDAGNVVTGILLPHFWDFGSPHAMLWTPATGILDFQEFLAAQGTFAPDWTLTSLWTTSGDGRTVGGVGYSFLGGQQGYVVQMPEVIVCHVSSDKPAERRSKAISFPDALGKHLGHGDTLGICGNGS